MASTTIHREGGGSRT
ncbi:unnamed protein product [Linum tenue]|uniref:Uncharacterized protein n=1 Tax=Linum tenue TaxID=586396 RepID=A0AAV0HF36_9ROSI|nr:unnamed protein product [Linum tenue]